MEPGRIHFVLVTEQHERTALPQIPECCVYTCTRARVGTFQCAMVEGQGAF